LCMLYVVLCKGAKSSCCEVAVVPILWFCLYVNTIILVYLLRICCVDGRIIILYSNTEENASNKNNPRKKYEKNCLFNKYPV
jgi:hypothetical protein